MRATGAVHLASIGSEVFLIQILFRWRSELVLRYACEAPFGKLASKYKQNAGVSDNKEERIEQCARRIAKELFSHQADMGNRITLKDVNDTISVREAVAKREGLELRKEFDTLKPLLDTQTNSPAENAIAHNQLKNNIFNVDNNKSPSDLIIVSTYEVVHRPTIIGHSYSREHWRCRCGWKFGFSSDRSVRKMPSKVKLICDGCFPKEKAAARIAEAPVTVSGPESSGSSLEG